MMGSVYRLCCVIFGVLLMSGCSLQMTTPPVTSYHLQPVTIDKIDTSEGCSDETMKVSLTLSPDLYQTRLIHYADAEYRQYGYTRSRWAESPSRQLRHMFESTMAQSGLYKSVVTYDSQVYNDLYFEPKLNEFMQYFDENGSAYVHVDMELVVMDQDSNRAISTLHIDKKMPTESADALGAVKAFNAVIDATMHETIGWLHDLCKQQSLPEEKRGQ